VQDSYRLSALLKLAPVAGPAVAVPLVAKGGNSAWAKPATSLRRRTGKVASSTALTDCINVLEGEAAELHLQLVHLPVGQQEDAIAVDIGAVPPTRGRAGHIVGRSAGTPKGSAWLARERGQPVSEPDNLMPAPALAPESGAALPAATAAAALYRGCAGQGDPLTQPVPARNWMICLSSAGSRRWSAAPTLQAAISTGASVRLRSPSVVIMAGLEDTSGDLCRCVDLVSTSTTPQSLSASAGSLSRPSTAGRSQRFCARHAAGGLPDRSRTCHNLRSRHL
jgi:hypothetical protein